MIHEILAKEQPPVEKPPVPEETKSQLATYMFNHLTPGSIPDFNLAVESDPYSFEGYLENRARKLLTESNNREWFNERVRLLTPFHEIISQLPDHTARYICHSADASYIRILDEDWPEELKKYAFREMVVNLSLQEPIPSAAWFKRILVWIQNFIPPPVLTLDHFGWRALADGKIYFWEELRKNMEDADWESLWSNPENITLLLDKAELVNRLINSYEAPTEEEYERLVARDSLPVTTVRDNQTIPWVEMEDVLRATGFEKIIPPLVQAIRQAPLDSDTAGSWDRKEIYLGNERGARLFIILMHETGHALQSMLSHDPLGYIWLNKYAAQTILHSTERSSYAAGYKLLQQEGVDDADYHYYVESFAEDFVLYWIRPEDLTSQRKQIFDEITGRYFPDIDHDDIRHKIRQIMGTYYGENITEEKTRVENCMSPATMAGLLSKLKKFSEEEEKLAA